MCVCVHAHTHCSWRAKDSAEVALSVRLGRVDQRNKNIKGNQGSLHKMSQRTEERAGEVRDEGFLEL